jgi:hypothetical protein
MAKELSTAAKTNALEEKLKGSSCYSLTRVTYIDDNDVEQEFSDAMYPIDIEKKSTPPRYANVNYTPAAATCNFQVINQNGVYSPKNTDSASSGILVRDRQFRFYDGKILKNQATELSVDLSLSTSTNIYCKRNADSAGDWLELDKDNTDGNTVDYMQDLFTILNSGTYDGDNYAPDAYAYFAIDRSEDNPAVYGERFTGIKVTANNTNGRIYYRCSNTQSNLKLDETASWIDGGATANGEKEIDFDLNAKYLYILIVFDTGDWDSGMQVSAVSYQYKSDVEWVLLGTFLLDEPKWSDKQSPNISTVAVSGRNAWKKALETNYNIEDLSAGVSLTQFIKDVADVAGLTYTATSIVDLASYGNRSWGDGYEDEVGIDEIYEDVMMIIGDTYRMYIDDTNVLYVQLRPTGFVKDAVFKYSRYLNAKQEYIGQKQLQRFTIFTDQQVVKATESLGSSNIVASGDTTISWAENAIYKYPVVTYNAGNDGVITNINMNNKSAVITVTGTVIDIDVDIMGCEFKSTEPTYLGEAVNTNNILNTEGFRYAEENPLVKDNTEADTICTNFISEYGTPAYNVTVQEAYLNPLHEINDLALLISQDFFEDTLYEETEIHIIMDDDVNKRTIVKLLDTGRKLSDSFTIIWDNALFNTETAIQWDTSLIWDSSYAIGSTRAEILAEKNYIQDLAFS